MKKLNRLTNDRRLRTLDKDQLTRITGGTPVIVTATPITTTINNLLDALGSI